jgi:hypothetical protein
MRCRRDWIFGVPFGALRVVLCGLVFTCGQGHGAAAAGAPSLTATAQQVRTRTRTVGLLPLWDTSWWVTVQASRAQAPLTRLEYSARFTDGSDSRPQTGGWDLRGGDADGLSGRVVVKCPARPDYDRRVRVQLRVRDALGGASEWMVADFPVRDEPRQTSAGVSAATQPGTDRPRPGAVEIEASDDMTIGQARAILQRKAREAGGDAAGDLRLVRSTADHATFAADVIRHKAAVPAPTAEALPAPSERVIGEIVFQAARR